jgi:SPASM domain peptide maturase of grasp-with-spasm system
VLGYSRSVIYDIQRNDFWITSIQIGELLLKKYFSYSEMKEIVGIEMIDILIENEIIFTCELEDIELFPKLLTEYNNPSQITNCILDINQKSTYNIESIVNQLNNFGLIKLQLRIFKDIDNYELCNLLDKFNNSCISSIEIILKKFSFDIDFLIQQYNRITSIILYNSENNKIININDCMVMFTNENLSSVNQCGVIEKEYFICSSELYFESINYNSCLNRKLSIDFNGNIKNCPASSHSFGNVNDTNIRDIISSLDFKKIWNIKKDQIDICKICEFRYMCIDCRVFIKDVQNIYSQPDKCKYNPYISKWEGELDYIPVEKYEIFNKRSGSIPNDLIV